eukprot:1190966-Pyramimonas_sp.AAC.1
MLRQVHIVLGHLDAEALGLSTCLTCADDSGFWPGSRSQHPPPLLARFLGQSKVWQKAQATLSNSGTVACLCPHSLQVPPCQVVALCGGSVE